MSQQLAPTPFFMKTYQIVEDAVTHNVNFWSESDNTFGASEFAIEFFYNKVRKKKSESVSVYLHVERRDHISTKNKNSRKKKWLLILNCHCCLGFILAFDEANWVLGGE